MKKIAFILILASTIFLNSFSQNVDDALRYSQVFYNGTARFMSMSGAFTALGGDLSAISLNPASTGVFRSFEVSLTPQMFYNNSNSHWNNSSTSDFRYSLGLSQIGAVVNLIPSNDHFNLNLAYSFNRTNNFNENVTIGGIGTLSSITDSWVSQANGTIKSELTNAAWLANQTYLIDTISGSNNLYASILSYYGEDANNTYGQTVRRVITNEGYSGEHAFSVGGNFSNKFFFGVTLGINTLKYTGHYQHLESDDDPAHPIYDFKSLTYTDHLEASGTGYSVNIGTIIKPVEFFRVGLAVHSPVVYRISEYFYDNVSSAFDNVGNDGNTQYEASNSPLRYKYTLTTPFRANAGIAFQIKKLAMLSADYEYVDYRMAQFSKASDNYNYSNENQGIKDILKSSFNLRFGAEFRISNLYLRGGYSYYGKAFNSLEPNRNLNYKGPSLGLGMRQKNFYFDMVYSMLSGSSQYYMYNDPGYLDPASIKTVKNNFTATIGFKF